MKMPADGDEAADAKPHDDSAPASEAAGEAGEHVVKSPKKKSRRRFQPKRSPKKKAKKTHEPPQTVGEEEGDDANKESESEEEDCWSAGLMCRFPAMRGGV